MQLHLRRLSLITT